MVDDFAPVDPGDWLTLGVELLRAVSSAALARGAAQLVVVTAHRDDAKRAALGQPDWASPRSGGSEPSTPSDTCPDGRCASGARSGTPTAAVSENGAVLDLAVLRTDDWQLWRRLRRAALENAPEAFGSTLAGWSGDGDTERRWRSRLDDVALNLVLRMDGDPVGMVSATAPGRDGDVELISLWVDPAARGVGVGDEAVRQVVAWAADTYPGSSVALSVKSNNRSARRLYERHGFVDAGPSPDDPAERLLRRRSTLH